MTATEYGRWSRWRDTAGLDEVKARDRASRLELRAHTADEIHARDECLRLLVLSPGECVLDVGCGSDIATRATARRVAPGGRAAAAT